MIAIVGDFSALQNAGERVYCAIVREDLVARYVRRILLRETCAQFLFYKNIPAVCLPPLSQSV